MSRTSASRWHVLYHLARADFLERLRRYSFLLTMGFALYFGYLAAVGRITLRLGEIRGVYNSAWIGALMALVVSTFLSLAGFYVVKNTIERDQQTRVGQILASTPMSKVLYVTGKWVSNYAVLAVVIAILAVCGIVMQLWLGEDRHIELWKLLAPSLLLALPAMAVVAALAVLFETISWLRGGFGNVLYFFVWTALLAMGIGSKGLSYDLGGLSLVMNSMLAASHTTDRSFSFSLDVGLEKPAHSAFVWSGIDWTAPIVLSRISWVGVAVLVTLAAAVFFDRFDAARGKAPAGTVEPMPTGPVAAEAVVTAARVQVAALTSLPRTPAKFRFGAMLAAELRLMLKGQKWWWYAGAAGLLIACAVVPSADARGILLGCAWIWPVLLWSQMGVRELRDQTNQLLFSTPHPIARQLPAVWLSGVILALLTGSGFAARLMIGGNVRGLLAWAIGALFIPTLALSLGVWSGSSKPFEIIYTLLWYVGPMHAMPPLDFMGSAPATAATRYPSVYLLLACGLCVAALAGRKRQLLT